MFHDVLCLIKSSIFHFSHIFRYRICQVFCYSEYKARNGIQRHKKWIYMYMYHEIFINIHVFIYITCTLYWYLMTRKSYICTSYWSKRFRQLTWELQLRICKKKKVAFYSTQNLALVLDWLTLLPYEFCKIMLINPKQKQVCVHHELQFFNTYGTLAPRSSIQIFPFQELEACRYMYICTWLLICVFIKKTIEVQYYLITVVSATFIEHNL